jgi:elongation factor G
LRSLSQGRASFGQQFSDYSPVPFDLQQKLSRKTQELELV